MNEAATVKYVTGSNSCFCAQRTAQWIHKWRNISQIARGLLYYTNTYRAHGEVKISQQKNNTWVKISHRVSTKCDTITWS